MILGILSDTHGQRRRAAAAIRLLRAAGATALVHCGDVGDAEVLEELAGLPGWIMPGNTDFADIRLAAHAEALGLVVATTVPLRLRLADRGLAVFHGHEPQFARLVDETLTAGALPADYADCQYILHGHTHIASVTPLGTARLVNPGALQRAPRHTVATLDLARDVVEFLRVTDEQSGRPA